MICSPASPLTYPIGVAFWNRIIEATIVLVEYCKKHKNLVRWFCPTSESPFTINVQGDATVILLMHNQKILTLIAHALH